ncbi:hypothetical protein J3Q64DRAFT_1705674 [Phycomyces blakesleeanus]|uniref:Anaphase-promoting complex subunit 4 WD40 domain-containing protein n=1 Tax=Phycomyces blakesleeanus TaxID=4837 RepID=A0ABR3BDN5_PHYBL
MRFHPRSRNCLACAVGTQLLVVDIITAKTNASNTYTDSSAIRTISSDHTKNISCLDWSDDGAFLVTSSDTLICVYETAHWKPIAMHTPHSKIWSCAFVTSAGAGTNNSGDKLRIMFGEYEAIYVWQGIQNSQPKKAGAPPGTIMGIACSRSGGQTVVATASSQREKNLMLWTI